MATQAPLGDAGVGGRKENDMGKSIVWFKAAFLGSVSNSLVGVARCPVLIAPCGVTALQ
jgi:nucleotide-binding universal stress UspA family protein